MFLLTFLSVINSFHLLWVLTVFMSNFGGWIIEHLKAYLACFSLNLFIIWLSRLILIVIHLKIAKFLNNIIWGFLLSVIDKTTNGIRFYSFLKKSCMLHWLPLEKSRKSSKPHLLYKSQECQKFQAGMTIAQAKTSSNAKSSGLFEL